MKSNSIAKVCISLFLVLTLVAGLVSCTQTKNSMDNSTYKISSSSDKDWYEESDTIIIENDNIKFEMDCSTTHFSVEDKVNGNTWFSTPQSTVNALSNEEINRLDSEVTVHYYSQETLVSYMHSGLDSVNNGKFKVLTNEKAVRVYYEMGAVDQVIPTVIDKNTFENKILKNLENDSMRRRIQRYYTFYSSKDSSDEYEEMKEKYPVLKDEELYIIGEMVSDIEREEIAEYMTDVNFTSDDYSAMLNRLKIKDDSSKKSAGFVIPVEYKINNSGFSAKILTDKIKENSPDYKLQSIDLLEYFAAQDNGAVGNFFVPDGSGALIKLNDSLNQAFTAPYYGKDYSINVQQRESIVNNLALPVFGMSIENGGYFAIVEGASEIASLNVKPMSDSSPLNHSYITFALRHIDATNYGESMNIPVYNLFSNELSAVSPEISFILLGSQNNNYSDMAGIYREYLIKEKGIESKNNKTEVFIDFLCMITEDTSFIGIPYQKKVIISTLEDIIKIIKDLHKENINNISVRLIGYTSNGVQHGAYNSFEIDKAVGTKAELSELAKLLKDNGGTLYLDSDVNFSYKKSKGFSPSDDAAQYLNRTVVYRGQRNIVTNEYSDELKRYLVSPSKYMEYILNFNEDLKNKMDNSSVNIGLSYGTAGVYLGGDYAKERDIDRTESVILLKKALDKVKKANRSMVFDGGNGYIIPYADILLNTPMRSSLYDVEKETVPFYQMVMHGLKQYSGISLNLSSDEGVAVLDSVAFGSIPYATFITKEDSLIVNTSFDTEWVSVSDEKYMNEYVNHIKNYEKTRDLTDGAVMTNYYKLDKNITVTEYSNGSKTFVNYGVEDFVIDGMNIPSGGYVTVGTKMRKKKSTLIEKRARFGYLFILPLIIGVFLIFIPNLVKTFLYSVSDIDATNGFALTFKGFGEYVGAFKSDPNFVPYMVDSLKNMVVQIPVIIIYSLFISTLLNQNFHGRLVARIIFFMPIILASGVIGLVDGQAMSYATGNGQVIDEGIALNMSNFLDITEFLNSLNFPKFLIDVVNSSISNIYTIAKASGLQIFVFLAGLQEISPSFYEAASIEGCSKWELFWKITFPIITPQTIANTVYTIAAFGMDYNIFFSYTNTLAFNQNNYSAATAMNLIYLSALALIVATIFLILKKISPKLDG